jgi:hypothetical protein
MIPGFSLLNNWNAEKQPTTNRYKFKNNDRASEFSVQQIGVLIDAKLNAGLHVDAVVDAGSYIDLPANRLLPATISRTQASQTTAMQYIIHISKLFIISKTNPDTLSISYMSSSSQQFFRLHNNLFSRFIKLSSD